MPRSPWEDGNNYQEDFWGQDDKPPTGLVWYALGAIALCVTALFVL